MHNYNMVQNAMVNIPHLKLLDIHVAAHEQVEFTAILQQNPQLQNLCIQRERI